LWKWHIRTDLHNHIVQVCNSKFGRRNLQQQPDESEDITDLHVQRVSLKKHNLEQSIIETDSSHIHNLVDNFEAYFLSQQPSEKITAMDFESL